jgi:hypothetical protein
MKPGECGLKRPSHFAVEFLVWLAYSPLNLFVWCVYVARIVYLVVTLRKKRRFWSMNPENDTLASSNIEGRKA